MNEAAAMPCPVCKVPLVMSERQGVEIDYCPQCRGVWLDRGELDKIIERNGADARPAMPPATPQQPNYSERDRGYDRGQGQSGDYRHGKRRKSFLEELFD
jgi:Zn-finger nucleic acid-binding protein